MASPIAEGVVPWPDDAVARYVAAGYWEGNSLGWQLWKQADRTPDQTAVVDGDVALTYGELIARADAAATGLANLGMRPGTASSCSCPTAGSSSSSPWRACEPASSR